MVVRGGVQSRWLGEDTSHHGQGRRLAIVVRGTSAIVVRGGDQILWSGEETRQGGQGRTPAIVVRGGYQAL